MPDNFTTLYQAIFFSSLGLLFVLERLSAFRRDIVRTAGRWTTNIGLLIIGGTIASIAFPAGLYGFAADQSSGLLGRTPVAAQVLITAFFLDLWRYWEHRLFHHAELLWRLHLVHHTDTEIDVTTTERHHPFEFLLSTATLAMLVFAFGVPAVAIGAYLIVATLVSLWSHSNLRVPRSIDQLLRCVIVTPRVHALHHSDIKTETNSNYGSVLTLWDRVFGTYVDPDDRRTHRYGLEYFHRPPDNSLGRALLQPFLYRVGMSYPRREDTSPPLDDVEGMPPRWRGTLLGGAAGALLAALMLWPTVLDLAKHWLNTEAYQYAWLIVPMGLYAAWDRRHAALVMTPRPNFTGALVAALAGVLWSVGALANIDLGRHIALVLALHGIAIAMLGWRCYWRFFPIVALLFLAIPSGDLLLPLLRFLTLKSIELVASVGQLPYAIDGFVVHIGGQRYIVIDECAGLSYVTIAVFLSYSFGLLLYRSFFKVVTLALFGAFIGFLANALRVNSIVLVDWFRGSQMDLANHGGMQWIALLVTLALLLFALSRLKADARETPLAVEAPLYPPNSARQFAPVAAGLGVLVIVGIVGGSLDDDVSEVRTAANAAAPERILGWKLQSPSPTWITDDQNQAATLTLVYERNGRKMDVLVIRPSSRRAKITESMLAPHDNKVWREAKVQRQTACIDSGCLPFVHTVWQRALAQEQRHVFHSYVIGRLTTDSKLALRLAHGWDRLTGGVGASRLIAFVYPEDPPSVDEIAAGFLALVPAMRDGTL
jgi:exosortase